MFEYMFFDHDLRQQFISFAHGHGVPCEVTEDSMGLVASVAEDIPEPVSDELDRYYDELLELQAERVDLADGVATHQAAGVRVTLDDGRPCMIKLDPDMANQLFSAFTLEEVQTLIQAIARSVANPDDGPICRRE